MIVGITGAICAGKKAIAMYLVQTYGFEAVNLLEIFRSRLLQELRNKDVPNSDSNPEEEEEAIKQLESDEFCHAYYKKKYRELRARIIKEVFRDLTGKWDRHFVVYPLSASEDIQLMV